MAAQEQWRSMQGLAIGACVSPVFFFAANRVGGNSYPIAHVPPMPIDP
jgi:hypothetical protein